MFYEIHERIRFDLLNPNILNIRICSAVQHFVRTNVSCRRLETLLSGRKARENDVMSAHLAKSIDIVTIS